MAQVDAFRFLRNLHMLFAPVILDGQSFTAYLEEDNSFSVQADNIIQASAGRNSSGAIDDSQVGEIASRLSALKTQADELERLCPYIPAINTAISSLSTGGTVPDEGAVDEFDLHFLYGEFSQLRVDVLSRIAAMEALLAEATATEE